MPSYLKFIILLNLFLTLLSQPVQVRWRKDCICYKMLGVAISAPSSEIKRAYKTLFLKYLPNTSPEEDVKTKFAELSNCYEMLFNDVSRTHYNYDCQVNVDPEVTKNYLNQNYKYLFFVYFIPLIRIFTDNPKKLQKIFPYLLVFGSIYMSLFYKPLLSCLNFAYELHGESILSVIVTLIISFYWIYFIVRKLCYFFGILSLENFLKEFGSRLREEIDRYQNSILEKANKNKSSAQDKLIQSEEEERGHLERLHNENKKEKSKKEIDAEKLHNQNLQALESKNSEGLEKINERYEEEIEIYIKTCDQYRNFVSEVEENLRIKIKNKEISHGKLEQELKKIEKDIYNKIYKQKGIRELMRIWFGRKEENSFNILLK